MTPREETFTANSIAYNIRTSAVLDPHGGSEDIRSMTLRCVGLITERFSEDPQRVLRAMRFCIAKGFSPSQDIVVTLNSYTESVMKFQTGQIIKIDRGDKIVVGTVTKSIPSNVNNCVVDDMLCCAQYIVSMPIISFRNGAEIESRTRFYERRNGAVFQSNGWKVV